MVYARIFQPLEANIEFYLYSEGREESLINLVNRTDYNHNANIESNNNLSLSNIFIIGNSEDSNELVVLNPLNFRSLSVGDIVHMVEEDQYYLCLPNKWKKVEVDFIKKLTYFSTFL